MGSGVNRLPTLSLNDVRQIATLSPELLSDADEYARKFYPKSSTARVA